MKVCMFVHHNVKHDFRVFKEAKTLTDAGHDVRIIAVLDKETEPYEEKEGIRYIRVPVTPIYYRVLHGIAKAESFAIGLILRLDMWNYHRTRRSSTPSSYQVEQPSTSTPAEVEQPSTSTPTEVEQPSSSAPLEDEPLILRAYRGVRKSYRWVRRGFFRGLVAAFSVFRRPLWLIDYYYRSWQIVKDEPADIYHSHDLTTLPIGYIARRRTGGKLVYDSHEFFTDLAYIPRLQRLLLFKPMERYLIRRVDQVIAAGDYLAEWLSKKYRIALPVVLLNCPPMRLSKESSPGNSLRERLGLDEIVPIIIYEGIIGSGRGLHNLVLSASYLNKGVIVFMGWGNLRDELQRYTEQRGLADKVLFVEPIPPDQVVDHISSASLGIVIVQNTSLNNYHNSPNKLYEYINAGLPVVASDFPRLNEVIEGYHIGKTFDPENPEDIAAAINWVLADKKRYEGMKKNTLKAAKRFNWENESRKLLEVYKRLSERNDDRAA